MNRKLLYFICFAAIVLGSAACSREDTPGAGSGQEGLYAIISEGLDSKVYMDADRKVYWNASDKVSVFNGSTANEEYAFAGQDGDKSGKIEKVAGTAAGTGSPAEGVRAVYPYGEDVTLSGETLSLTLPAQQAFGSGTFAPGASPMAAYSTDNNLSFKISYGENGNDQIGAYRYINYYNIVNSNDNAALVPATLGNPDISWEKNGKFNVGVDFSFWNGRLTGGIEYYSNTTKDMLSYFTLPNSYGYGGYYANIGDMRNSGIEISVNGDIIRNKELTWSAYANLTSNHNEITRLPEERKTQWTADGKYQGYKSGNFFYTEGESRYSYYTRSYAGVYTEDTYQSTGDEEYDPSKAGSSLWYKYRYKQAADGSGNELDANGNPIVESLGTTYTYSEADYMIIDDVLPDVYGGFGTSISWKGIDFSFQLNYSFGRKIYGNSLRYDEQIGGSFGENFTQYVYDNRWKQPGDITDVPRLNVGYGLGTESTLANSHSSRFLMDGNYVKLRNITLGYTFPSEWTEKFYVSRLRVYVQADNLYTWGCKNYRGFDPSSVGANGVQWWNFPQSRNVVFGVNVSF